MEFQNAYKNRVVLVTGHTGFKGSWLCEWLLMLGAKVVGFSLEPPTRPSHYALAGLGERLFRDFRGDVRSLKKLKNVFTEQRPDFVFHLAAQPIVRRSYQVPEETFETNVMGTFNVLEAIRTAGIGCTGIMITTDKVYENIESGHRYAESDPLGGFDPYSARKACAEIIISSYERSFFKNNKPLVGIASVRAGNVIGGGDWGRDRIVPDCIRSLVKNQSIPVRNKVSTRPWQHVLEPLGGYLLLGAAIHTELHAGKVDADRLDALCSPFNFGPEPEAGRTVLDLVSEILSHWPGSWVDKSDPGAPHEAGQLNLSIEKAARLLQWKPRWDFETTIRKTVEWYKECCRDTGDSKTILRMTRSQIQEYCE